MAKACWQSAIADAAGNVVAAASVEVRDSVTGNLAALFEDRDGADGLDNPFFADGNGFARFFVAEGTYNIAATHVDFGTRTWQYVALFENTDSSESAAYQSVSIAAGQVDDWEPAGVDTSTGFLDVNPSAGNTDLTGILSTLLRNGQTLTITNVHASNLLVLKALHTGSASGNRMRAAYDLTLGQYMSVTIRKSTGLGQLLVIP